MKTPKKLLIGSKRYKIVSRPRAWGEENKAYGMIHYNKDLIEFDRGQNPEELVDTLIHEVLHAVAEEYNVKFKSSQQEESVVSEFAHGLKDVFKNNPNFLHWMLSKFNSE
jgi:hypothetical protein